MVVWGQGSRDGGLETAVYDKGKLLNLHARVQQSNTSPDLGNTGVMLYIAIPTMYQRFT